MFLLIFVVFFMFCSSSSVLLADLGSLKVTSDMKFAIPDVSLRVSLIHVPLYAP